MDDKTIALPSQFDKARSGAAPPSHVQTMNEAPSSAGNANSEALSDLRTINEPSNFVTPHDATLMEESVHEAKSAQRSTGRSAAVEFAEGDMLGKYRIEGELGRGAMGVVLLGCQADINRKAAIKVLPRSVDADAVARFRREAEAVARLSHPNIIQIYDYDVDRGVHFYAMEYIKGQDLADLIYKERASYQKGAQIIAECARALHYAHGMGVLHRDIKPANILIGDDQKARLTDFGLARVEGNVSLTMEGTILGTPMYMSPEQASGEGRLTRQADIYSLGATLYELAAGAPPYKGRDAQTIVLMVIQKPPKSPLTVDPHMPPALAAIISRAMARVPSDRYASGKELAEDLEGFIQGKNLSLKANAAWASTKDRNSVIGLVIMGVVLVFLTAGLAVKIFQFSDRKPGLTLAEQRQLAKDVIIGDPTAATPEFDELLRDKIELTEEAETKAKSMSAERARLARQSLEERSSQDLLPATKDRAEKLAKDATAKYEEGDQITAQAVLNDCLQIDPNNKTAQKLQLKMFLDNENFEDVIHGYTMILLDEGLGEKMKHETTYERGLTYQELNSAEHDILSAEDLSTVEGEYSARAQLSIYRLHIRRRRFALAFTSGTSFLKEARSQAYVSKGLLSKDELAEAYLLHAQLLLKIGRPLETAAALLTQGAQLAEDEDIKDQIRRVVDNIRMATQKGNPK
ncbi:MAG: serine/threonine-protein kinase [Planctomycetota bacterium]|nr:serine/threonine-protein kinase [Planctomycetota bacterium]